MKDLALNTDLWELNHHKAQSMTRDGLLLSLWNWIHFLQRILISSCYDNELVWVIPQKKAKKRYWYDWSKRLYSRCIQEAR